MVYDDRLIEAMCDADYSVTDISGQLARSIFFIDTTTGELV